MRFRDKVVLVTGGARNIGRETAFAFAREGARIMIADYDVMGARDTIADLQEVTEECAWVRIDVRSEDDIVRMRDATVRTFGRIDILLNNVGYGSNIDPLESLTAAEWDAAFVVNVRQQFLCAKYAIPEMIRGGGGVILNAGTVFSLVAGTASLNYPAAKAGVVNLTRHIAMYYAPQKIRANCVCPGHIATPTSKALLDQDQALIYKYPAGRLGRVPDVVAAYLYLASDEASFVTGAVVVVDGGYSLQ